MGSLSTVIGFLPQDKELHAQRLGSRPSSSPDFDEDMSKPQAEQDSLNFHCQHALQEASSDSDDLRFDLVPSQEEVADSGGELYSTSFLLYPCQQPKQSLTQQSELHNMTQPPSPPWWGVVQEAKGKASTTTSYIQLDYVYMRQSQDNEPTTIPTWVESLTGRGGSLMVKQKGPTAHQIDAVVTFLKRQGFEHSTLQCDGKPALVKLVAAIG